MTRDDIETLYQVQQWFERATADDDAALEYLNGEDVRDDGCDGWDDAITLYSKLSGILPRLATPTKD